MTSLPWREELRNPITTVEHLERLIDLTEDERAAVQSLTLRRHRIPFKINRSYAALMDPADSLCPVRRSVVPSTLELQDNPCHMEDPLAEGRHMVMPGVVHRYPDRILVLLTDLCASHCRFCTRGRWTGRKGWKMPLSDLPRLVSYLEHNPNISEVILSGGDPLVFDDGHLDKVLAAIRNVQTVEVLRLGTRIPVLLPHRITSGLVRTLRKHAPVYVLTHFNSPRELTPNALDACGLLVDGGVPVENQTVLLRGINDTAPILAALFRGLLRARVRPYYLHQCDLSLGSHAFSTPLTLGMALMEELRLMVGGLAIPQFVIDLPGGHGKVPLLKGGVVSLKGDHAVIATPGGKHIAYPEGVEVAREDHQKNSWG